VIDMQECPQADLAIAAAAVAAVRALYDATWSPLVAQQAIATAILAQILHRCVQDGERAIVDDADYLRLLGLPAKPVAAADVWRHLTDATAVDRAPPWHEPLRVIQEHGPLARRVLRALGPNAARPRQRAVYEALCDCLDAGQMFLA
jgi:hypothetical protein